MSIQRTKCYGNTETTSQLQNQRFDLTVFLEYLALFAIGYSVSLYCDAAE